MEDEDSLDNVPIDKEYLKEFIRVWETCPELWKTSSNDYRDKMKRNIALDKLLDIYKNIKPASTREDVKKKLNSLRTNFRKELKKIAKSKSSGKGTDDIYVPSNWTYYELLFLSKDEQPVIQKHDSTESTVNTETQDHQRYSVSSMDPPVPPTRTGTKKKKVDQQTLIERAVSLMERSDTDNNSKDQDEFHHLAIVWAAKLRKLTPTQKRFAEKAIHDILFEAELGNLHRNSVKINNDNNSSVNSRETSVYYVPSPTISPSIQNSNLSYISSPSPQSVSQPVSLHINCSQQPELVQTQTYSNETATLFSFNNNNPIIRSGDPAQIVLRPRANQPHHFSHNIVSQETVYDSPSVITTTIADVHCDADKMPEPSKITLKEYLQAYNLE